jgi:hypothetical protein
VGKHEDFIYSIVPYISSWAQLYSWGVVSAICAQACLESGYGTSDKAQHNNYFGLKYKGNRVTCNSEIFEAKSAEQLPDGTYVTITTEWYGFAGINTGVQGYFQFIDSGRYDNAKKASDPRTYLQCLKDSGYATSINYVDNCMKVIEKYNLTQYDQGGSMYTNSSLVSYVDLSPGNYGPRSHKIDTITIHHMAGNLSVETCGRVFHNKKGNSNYGIGSDGRIALYVEEKNGAWTSSNKTNDMRAITIEVANNSGAPNWTISPQALNSLLLLCADICRRNDIKALIWSPNKSDRINHVNGCNMTMHKDFSATACPGPFIESIEGLIAIAVNQMLTQSGYVLNGYDYAPVFDPEYYANRYPDLRAAFGSDSKALWDHFCSFGMMEFRQASDEFDPVYYKAMYPDLVAAYGNDNPMYYFHYVATGKAEGRKGHA